MVRLAYRIFVALLGLTLLTSTTSAHSLDRSGSSAEAAGAYTLVLVDAASKADLARARDFIMSQGGTVAIVLPPHAIMGWIPAETDSKILGRYGISSIFRSPLSSPPSGFRDH